MEQEKLDLLLLTQPEHFNWLSGYDPTGTFYFQALLVPVDDNDDLTLICNRIEYPLYEETCCVEDVHVFWTYEDQVLRTKEVLAQLGFTERSVNLGLNLSGYNLKPQYVLDLQRALPKAKFTDVTPPLDELRLVKSSREVTYLRQAAHLADLGLRAGIDAIQTGATDHEVMAAIQATMAANGSESPAFPYLVDARGVGHGTPVGTILEVGQNVCLECETSV